MKNLGTIKNRDIRSLSEELYTMLTEAKLEFKSEIEVDDVYFQVDRGQIFLFSIDIRGDMTEFYLKRLNFAVFNDGNVDAYVKQIILIVKSIIDYDFKIVRLELFGKILRSEIIFNDRVHIAMHTNFVLSKIDFLFLRKIKKTIVEGREYLT